MTVPIGIVDAWNILPNVPISLSFLARFEKPLAFFKRTLASFSIWFRKPTSLLAALAFTWIHMLCLFGSIYIFVADLGGHASFWTIAGIWSVTYFITLLPISINGYGVQEYVFASLLSQVVGFVPSVAITIAVLIRAYFLLSSLPGALSLPSILAALAKQKTVVSSPESLV
jgi:glycosyltransferase 2 family protein